MFLFVVVVLNAATWCHSRTSNRSAAPLCRHAPYEGVSGIITLYTPKAIRKINSGSRSSELRQTRVSSISISYVVLRIKGPLFGLAACSLCI